MTGNLTWHLSGIILAGVALSSPARSIPWTLRETPWSIRASVEAHHKEVGVRLRQLREARGWNQEDAAHETGVGAKTWGEWERGKRWPYEYNWKKIGETFEVDPHEIKGAPPSPLGLDGRHPVAEQLDRIEAKLDELLNELRH